MLVAAGHPLELDAHMARLAADLEAVFDAETPTNAVELVRNQARPIALGRLRLTVAPDDGGKLMAEATAVEIDPGLVFPSPEQAVSLSSLLVEGGLGARKWADRSLLEGAEAKGPAVPLLRDVDGAVLEASRGNVFLVGSGALATPPTDGRILPGIARRQAIEVARAMGIEVREAELSLTDLMGADEVFLTGSVRGIEPVRSIDGAALSPAGEVTGLVSSALRRRWLG